MNDKNSPSRKASRRKFIKTAAYVAPAIITLSAHASFASAGSGRPAGSPRERGRLGGFNLFDLWRSRW